MDGRQLPALDDTHHGEYSVFDADEVQKRQMNDRMMGSCR